MKPNIQRSNNVNGSLITHFLPRMPPPVVCFFLFVLLTFCQSCQAQTVLLPTRYGTLRGFGVPFPSNPYPIKTINTYLGIPYALPPTGDLRLKPPIPPVSWKPNVYDATRHRNVCIQQSSPQHAYYKSVWPAFDPKKNFAEDCLYLNVYSPMLRASYPVMVYIHGGGFQSGTSLLSPGYQLALKGVVVVTIQYRLGAFGFMSTGKGSGNYGLLDQVQALKWVAENIEAFYGNPNEVTIFGFGAGAVSVSLHLLSPISFGLFHRAACESGVDLAPQAVHNTVSVVNQTRDMAQGLGCHHKESDDLLECLRKVDDPWRFLSASGNERFSFGPIIDGHFLRDRPSVLRKKGLFSRVPLIAGITPNENSLYLGREIRNLYGISNISSGIDKSTFERYCQRFARSLQSSTRYAGLLFDALFFEYSPSPWPEMTGTQDRQLLLQKLIDLSSDYNIWAPTSAALIAHSQHAPTYMFLFNHRSKLSADSSWAGVAHGSTRSYVLGLAMSNSSFTPQFFYDDIDSRVSAAMVAMWTNLAKFGNPTQKPVFGVTWDQFSQSNQAYMSFDGQPAARMAKSYQGARAAFWNYYYEKLMNESPSCPVTAKSVGARWVACGYWTWWCLFLTSYGIFLNGSS